MLMHFLYIFYLKSEDFTKKKIPVLNFYNNMIEN